MDSVISLDAVYTGNLMRFANHSHTELANCYIRLRFAQGMQRVCLFSGKNIEAGEELFFDYCFKKEFEWLNAYNEKYSSVISN